MKKRLSFKVVWCQGRVKEMEKTQMSIVISGLLYCWDKNLDYGQKLIADLDDAQMVLQPAPDPAAPANHSAWVFSHLNAYLPVIQSLIEGVPFDDPKQHRFGMQSKPESDPAIYPSKHDLLNEFVQGHESVTAALKTRDDSILANPVTLERWQNLMPNLGTALPYLMACHENMHLGQISAWRRIQGMPSV